MKNLKNYISESLLKESDDKLSVRIPVKGMEHADDLINSIKSIGVNKSVYVEDTEDGVLIKVTAETADSFVDLLQEYVNSYEKKEEDDTKLAKVQASIEKMIDFSENSDEEE